MVQENKTCLLSDVYTNNFDFFRRVCLDWFIVVCLKSSGNHCMRDYKGRNTINIIGRLCKIEIGRKIWHSDRKWGWLCWMMTEVLTWYWSLKRLLQGFFNAQRSWHSPYMMHRIFHPLSDWLRIYINSARLKGHIILTTFRILLPELEKLKGLRYFFTPVKTFGLDFFDTRGIFFIRMIFWNLFFWYNISNSFVSINKIHIYNYMNIKFDASCMGSTTHLNNSSVSP